MTRFVSQKTYKIHSKRLYFSILIITLIIIINSILKYSLKKINDNKILNLLANNSYGISLNKNNKNSSKYNNFYKNIYGINLYSDTKVTVENNNINELIVNTKPLIYLYNTYQTDKYINEYYSSYSINPVITQASLILHEYLKKYNINSVVEKNSVAKILKENNIDYFSSYKASRILMEQAKKENNSLEYFFDIGMSDDNYLNTTVEINSIKYAKILFIVGTDNINYKLNQDLAIKLNDELLSINKELTRGISLRGGQGYQGVYNQDFSSNSLLIYVGGKENKIEEVNRSLIVLAEAIKNYIKGDLYEKE
ncbi:MAG: hypothetical protein E7163_02945 [Firmicutes bacterium]|nr:hypothetical protein [Bacillota bacterium]